MAEEFPSFDLGFDFLNDQNNKEEGKLSGEAAIDQKKGLQMWRKRRKSQLLLEVQAKATNAFKSKETQ